MKLTFEQYQSKVKRWTRRYPDAIVQAFKEELPYLVRDAVRTHLSGPRMAKGKGSKANATLARQSGFLARSIQGRIRNAASRVIGQIGTKLGPYPKLHEEGIGKMPERPFLAPTVKRNKKRVMQEILKRIIRSYNAQR